MIAHLKGRLDATGVDHAVVDVGGVGYLVGASSKTLASLGAVGEAVGVAALVEEVEVAMEEDRMITAGEAVVVVIMIGMEVVVAEIVGRFDRR